MAKKKPATTAKRRTAEGAGSPPPTAPSAIVKFRVTLPHCPSTVDVFEADDEAGAIAAFKLHNGISNTDHQFTVERLG